ncbi:MAG: type 4a pilus biogenesis protein PilO [Candidatus Omnitrophica bacterium]|nr:type 4a pilus biogenesis protein PilO [Candidatus Omnitrophota bacterium]
MNINKNTLVHVGIIILVLIIASNIYKRQKDILRDLKKKENSELEKNKVISNINQLEKLLTSYRPLFVKDNSLLITTISNIARETDVKIISFQPRNEIKLPTYIKYPVDLTLEARNYHFLGRFLSKLESYAQVFVVESLRVASPISALAKGKESNLEVSLSLYAVSLLKE